MTWTSDKLRERILDEMKASGLPATACGCIGPQNGEPVCPCRMRSVTQKDGRYIQIIDLGPVKAKQ